MRLNQVRERSAEMSIRTREGYPKKKSRNGFIQPICQNNQISGIKRRDLYKQPAFDT